MLKLIGRLVIVLVFAGWIGKAAATPILLNPGERAIFSFDFSGMDISAAQGLEYRLETTLADGTPFLFFDLDFNLYDELGEAAHTSCCNGNPVSPSLSIHLGPFAAFYDDPISYLELGFNEVEFSPAAVRMSITATALTDNGPNPQEVARVVGVPSIVPTPATIVLLVIALAGLVLARATGSTPARLSIQSNQL